MFWSAKYKALRMAKKLLKLNRLGKHESAIEVADKLYSQYINSEDQQERTHARLALIGKTPGLFLLGRYREVLVHADHAIEVFTDSKLSEDIEGEVVSDYYIRELNRVKIKALHALEEYDKALLLIDSVLDDFITHTHHGTEYITTEILLLKADIFKIKKYDINDRLAVFNQIINRYRKSKDFNVLENVLHALTEILIVCVELDDHETALTISQTAKELDSRADEVKVQRIITSVEQFEVLSDESKKELIT